MEASNFAEHSQLDLSDLTKPTNIRTERELEQEVSKICETLKDTCKPLPY